MTQLLPQHSTRREWDVRRLVRRIYKDRPASIVRILAFAGKVPNIGPAITTLTSQPGTDVACEDTTDLKAILKPSSAEFINTGCGAWHQRRQLGCSRATGFQLWVAMPPGLEENGAFGCYVPPGEVPRLAIPRGEVRVLLGQFAWDGRLTASLSDLLQQMSLVVIRLEYCRKPILQKVRLIGIAAQPNAFDAATQPADGDANKQTGSPALATQLQKSKTPRFALNLPVTSLMTLVSIKYNHGLFAGLGALFERLNDRLSTPLTNKSGMSVLPGRDSTNDS